MRIEGRLIERRRRSRDLLELSWSRHSGRDEWRVGEGIQKFEQACVHAFVIVTVVRSHHRAMIRRKIPGRADTWRDGLVLVQARGRVR